MYNNLYNLISNNKFNKIKSMLNKDDTIINNEINDSKYLVHYSLQFNKFKLFKKIIKLNPKQLLLDINKTKNSILMIAQQTGIYKTLDKVIELIKKEFPIELNNQLNKKNINGLTLLNMIIYNNNLDEIIDFLNKNNKNLELNNKYLLSFIDRHYNKKDSDINKIKEIINLLTIDKNILITEFDDMLLTKLIYVDDDKNINYNFIDYIISLNYKQLDVKDKDGINFIIYPIIENDEKLLDIMLKYCKTNNVDYYNNISNYGDTIVFNEALKHSNINIINKLLDMKYIDKSINIIDDRLQTSLFYCLDNKNNKFNKDIITKIFEKTNDINLKNINGNNIWHLIFNRNDYNDYLHFIDKFGGDIYTKNKLKIRPIDNIKNKDKDIKQNIIKKFAIKYQNLLLNDKDKVYYKSNDIKYNNLDDIINYIKKTKNSYPIKKDDLIDINMDDNEYTYFNLYNARDWDIYTYIIILLNKYEKLGVPYCDPKSFDKTKNILLKNEKNNEYGKMINDYLTTWNNYPIFYNISIYWHSKDLYNIPYNYIDSIKNTIDNGKYYILIRLDIINNVFHSNILFIDINNKSIIRFEPQGGLFVSDSIDIDSVLSSYFINNNTFFKDYTYFKPSDYMPLNGFQSISNEINHFNMKKGDMGGFCSAWCLLFVELYLKNVDIINKFGLKSFYNKTMKKMINSQYMVTEQIRNYANHLHKKQNEYLLKNNFEYEKLYNYRFNSTDYTKLLKLLSNTIENNIIN